MVLFFIRLLKYLDSVVLESGCEKRDGRWARGGCKEKQIVRNGTEFTVWERRGRFYPLACYQTRMPPLVRGIFRWTLQNGTVWDRLGERKRQTTRVFEWEGRQEGRENKRSRKLMSHTELKLREKRKEKRKGEREKEREGGGSERERETRNYVLWKCISRRFLFAQRYRSPEQKCLNPAGIEIVAVIDLNIYWSSQCIPYDDDNHKRGLTVIYFRSAIGVN